MSDPAEQSPTPPAPPVPPASDASPAGNGQAWTPPGAAPFGGPAVSAPTAGGAPTGSYAPPAGAYAPPTGYAPPPGYGPAAPAGYGPAGGLASSPLHGTRAYAPGPGFAPAGRGRGLGFVALMLALGATVGTTLVATIATFTVGLEAPGAVDYLQSDFDWSTLTPVRGWALVVDIAFWVGTILGVWAIVQGIIAAVSARGRAAGISAIVVAALGPVVFGLVAVVGLVAGATGSGLA